MAQNLGDLVVKFRAETNQFMAGMKKSSEELEKFEKAAAKAEKGTGVFARNLKSMGSAVGSINVLLSTTARVMTGVFDAANEGAKNAAAEKFFARSGKEIQKYRQATAGMISDAELMKKANMADSMGISQDVFQQLAKVAQASALKTGQSFDYMFNSIIVGTARSSRLLLDNLGIIVSVEAANKNYAAAHKKAGQSVADFIKTMDDESKKVAFAEEVMRQSQQTVKDFGEMGEMSAARFDKFTAATKNLSDALKAGLAGAVDGVLPTLTTFLNLLKDIVQTQGLAAAAFTALKVGAVGFAEAIGTRGVGPGSTQAVLNDEAYKARTAKDAKKNELLGNTTGLKIAIQQSLAKPEDFDRVVQMFVDRGATFVRQVDPLIKTFLELNEQAGYFHGQWKKATPETPKPPKASDGKKDHSMDYPYGFIEKLAKKREEIEEKIAQGAIDAKSREAEHYLKFNQDLKDARLARKKAEMELIDQRIANEQAAADAILEARKKIEEQLAARDAQIGSTVGSIASGGGIAGPIMTAVAPMVGAAIGGPLGAIVGALMPILGAVVDGLGPVVRLIESLTNGIQLLVKNGLQEFLSILNPITEALQPLLAVIGLLVGGLLRVLIGPLKLIVQAAMFSLMAFTAIATVASAIAEIMMSLWAILGDLFLGLFGMDTTDILYAFTNAIQQAGKWLIETAISFNNAIVKFMRNTLGQKAFGKILSKEDFIVMSDEENTDAVKENTKAIRDFSREFRNLPQGYRIESATYSSTRTVPRPGRIGADLSSTLASAPSANDLVRWRN